MHTKLFALLFLLIFAVACNSAVTEEVATIEPTLIVEEMMEEEVMVEETAVSTPTTQSTTLSPEPLDISTTLDAFAIGNLDGISNILEKIRDNNDTRFIPVLVELYRASQIGLVRAETGDVVDTINTLAGTELPPRWDEITAWYGTTDYEPPEGFKSWKGLLYSRIDPTFETFFQDGFENTIRVEEIQWGGVVRDGIPPLIDPPMIPADEALYMEPNNPVFGLSLNGDTRAYPLRILDWHEMANDTVGGIPVSLAYCTLCGAGIAWDGRADNGEIYTFGTSGFLYRSNKLMYDRQTDTMWNQFTGRPVLGELVGTDVSVPILPMVLTTWEEWVAQHPDTLVVAEDTGFNRVYASGEAYGRYFESPDTMFPVPLQNDALEQKDFTYIVRVGDAQRAYGIDQITAEKVVNDVVADTPVVVVAPNENIQVVSNSSRGSSVYNSGAEVRVYERGEHAFAQTDNPLTLVDETGTEWQLTINEMVSADGDTLPRINGHLGYWFAVVNFYPDATLYGN